MPPALRAALDAFATALTRNFADAAANPAQPEDQLKGPMQELLAAAGTAFGANVVARAEARTDLGVRPDLGVTVDRLLAGHIELKAPGKGAQTARFSDAHDRQQARRLAGHPNLVYTDGNEWALYRNGARVGQMVRAEGNVTTDGARAFSDADAVATETLLRDFLFWQPLVPSSPKALAELLAPLTRLLRENVASALEDSSSALAHLAREWRDVFFPDADDAEFADAYAQTLTYALLLARVEGEADLHVHAPERLDRRHGLLAQVLRVLAQPEARQEVEVPVSLLERVIGAVDPDELARRAGGQDVWLYFYEDFLAAYDPRLRRQRGVYFTPPAVVQAQTTLVSELLRERFDKHLGFADDDVTVLDPALGTGTYLLAALQDGVSTVRERFGEGAVAGRVSAMAQRFHGFELQVGAYAVAHLRVSQQILAAGGTTPADGVHVYLTDTLESPYLAPPGYAAAPLFTRKLADENERARRVKRDVRVLVCIGNPPYFRQVIDLGEEEHERRLGGWVRYGDGDESDGILRDFLRGAPGVHAKNLYNLYVYFWRWALWKVFEHSPHGGIVSFITASSYLRGPGFAGMRRHLRETFDELWVLDLGGEGRGARRSENVFAIQTPVAIAIGVRCGEPTPREPARVRYAQVNGTREEKYEALRRIGRFAEIDWRDCFSEWTAPLLPEDAGDYFSWPPLTDVFPWQHSGTQFKRTWPIAPDRSTLERRWRQLMLAAPDDRPGLFRETRDRTVDVTYASLAADGGRLLSLSRLGTDEPSPPTAAYAYRSFDRQYCLLDNRLGDFLRPALWRTLGPRQLFLTSLLTGVLGVGRAATVTHLVPDLDHFRGSFGAKHVVPLWRDAAGTIPNITAGLLGALGDADAVDLFAYCYAILSAPSYVERFEQELEVPGPRIPITRDATLFDRAAALGRRLIWLHTYGERLVPEGERPGEIPPGSARAIRPVTEPPASHSWDETTQELQVGDGAFAPVSAAVRGFSVSGLDVVGSWLDYRSQEGAGRRSSLLDRIRPLTWPPQHTEELLRLLWILEHTVALGPALDGILDQVVAGGIYTAEELPAPTDDERRAPG
jgi:hypothetical protein